MCTYNYCNEGDSLQAYYEMFTACIDYPSSEWSQISNYIDYSAQILVQSLNLAPSAPMLFKVHSTYLGKTIEPLDAHYETIDWSSSDESIVTVDSTGKITGVSVGTVNVTAKIGDVFATVPVTVYELSTNLDEQKGLDENQQDEITDTAGSIIDDIANNDEPDLSNTDIKEENLENIKEEITEAANNGSDFWVNFENKGRGLGHYQQYWDDPQFWVWYSEMFGKKDKWNFGGGNDVTYTIGYTDSNGKDHAIGNITEFDEDYGFYFEIPEGAEIEELNNGKKRIYNVVRFHDGGYDIVDIEVDKKGRIKVKSNKYSDFMLLYQDVDIVSNDTIIEAQTHSATLNDNIALNTYLKLNDGITNPTMTAWIDENHPVEVTGKVQDDGRYKFAFGVAAPQMTAAINYTITASDENGAMVTEVNTYSIQEYGEAIIKSDSPDIKPEMKELAAQMLNYGAYTQTYFGCNKDNLANRNLEQLGYSTALDTGAINPNAAASFTDFNGEIKAQFTTNSVIFESETALKYYMTLDDDVQNAYMAYRLKDSNDAYKYIPLTPTGNRYYAVIRGIQTPLLTDVYESFICIKDGDNYTQISNTKYYSPEMYATAIWNQSQSEAMKNVAVAMMMYCRSARTYFNLDQNNG